MFPVKMLIVFCIMSFIKACVKCLVINKHIWQNTQKFNVPVVNIIKLFFGGNLDFPKVS